MLSVDAHNRLAERRLAAWQTCAWQHLKVDPGNLGMTRTRSALLIRIQLRKTLQLRLNQTTHLEGATSLSQPCKDLHLSVNKAYVRRAHLKLITILKLEARVKREQYCRSSFAKTLRRSRHRHEGLPRQRPSWHTGYWLRSYSDRRWTVKGVGIRQAVRSGRRLPQPGIGQRLRLAQGFKTRRWRALCLPTILQQRTSAVLICRQQHIHLFSFATVNHHAQGSERYAFLPPTPHYNHHQSVNQC